MNSKSPTNWINLPMEMRCECIQWMDFKSRMSLRATSHTEKTLVESSPKIHFDFVQVELDVDYEPSVIGMKDFEETLLFKHKTLKTNLKFVQKARHLVVQLLKFAIIDHFEFCDKFDYNDAPEFVSNAAPMQFKSLQLKIDNKNVIEKFLEKCETIEKLVLNCPYRINISQFELFRRVKTIQLKGLKLPLVPYQLLKSWIHNDMELGTTLQAHFEFQAPFGFFAAVMNDRAVSRTYTELRLSTDNPAKHILIRRVPDFEDWATEHFLSFHVISADQNASEYEKNDQWVKNFKKEKLCRDVRQAKLAMEYLSIQIAHFEFRIKRIDEAGRWESDEE